MNRLTCRQVAELLVTAAEQYPGATLLNAPATWGKGTLFLFDRSGTSIGEIIYSSPSREALGLTLDGQTPECPKDRRERLAGR